MHHRNTRLFGWMFALALLAPAHARDIVRIDAHDARSASQSFGAMIGALPANEQRDLIEAVALLNLRGVKSAQELDARADLRNGFGIARIKDEVAGMSAEEIVALAREVPDISIVRSD